MIDSQRGAERRVGYNHLISNKREWNNCFIKNAHKILVESPRLEQTGKDKGLPLFMSHVYQNYQRANGLAWTA